MFVLHAKTCWAQYFPNVHKAWIPCEQYNQINLCLSVSPWGWALLLTTSGSEFSQIKSCTTQEYRIAIWLHVWIRQRKEKNGKNALKIQSTALHNKDEQSKAEQKRRKQRKSFNVILIDIPVFPPKGNCSTVPPLWHFGVFFSFVVTFMY